MLWAAINCILLLKLELEPTARVLVWFGIIKLAKHYLFLGAAHSIDMAYSADLG